MKAIQSEFVNLSLKACWGGLRAEKNNWTYLAVMVNYTSEILYNPQGLAYIHNYIKYL